MTSAMTITELVRDTGKEASHRAQRGDSIIVRSGRKVLFRILPPESAEVELSAAELKAVASDLEAMTANAPNNPVLALRDRRP